MLFAILFQLSLSILVHYRCLLYLALEGGPPFFELSLVLLFLYPQFHTFLDYHQLWILALNWGHLGSGDFARRYSHHLY